jgi:hypothetical protein
VYHLEGRVSSGRGVYHLEWRGRSRRVSGVVGIIWPGRESITCWGVYHLEGRVSSGRGGYHLAGEYHLEGRVSSGRGGYHLEGEYHLEWPGRVSSGAGEYHLEGRVSSVGGGYRLYHLSEESIIYKKMKIQILKISS